MIALRSLCLLVLISYTCVIIGMEAQYRVHESSKKPVFAMDAEIKYSRPVDDAINRKDEAALKQLIKDIKAVDEVNEVMQEPDYFKVIIKRAEKGIRDIADIKYSRPVDAAIQRKDVVALKQLIELIREINKDIQFTEEPNYFIDIILKAQNAVNLAIMDSVKFERTYMLIDAAQKSNPNDPENKLYAKALEAKFPSKEKEIKDLQQQERELEEQLKRTREERQKKEELNGAMQRIYIDMATKDPHAVIPEKVAELKAKEAAAQKKESQGTCSII